MERINQFHDFKNSKEMIHFYTKYALMVMHKKATPYNITFC